MVLVLGLITAILLYLIPYLKDALYPLLILSQNIPTIVLAPLLVIWFGFGMLPKIIVITLVCFFPVTVAALDGFKQTPSELKHYLAMAGANKRQMFWKLEFPYAFPSIFSGIKISATYSVLGAVISEWFGAKEGIGVYMTLASSSFRTDRVFVAIFVIMILSLLLFALIQGLEKILVRWHDQGDEFKMTLLTHTAYFQTIFRSHSVIHHLSLHVQEGEFVSILGPSGSGKSTLFHLIGGILTPDEGMIL